MYYIIIETSQVNSQGPRVQSFIPPYEYTGLIDASDEHHLSLREYEFDSLSFCFILFFAFGPTV